MPGAPYSCPTRYSVLVCRRSGPLLASVVKRHGLLIELALKEVLERDGRYIVLRDIAMPITTTTQELIRTGTMAQLATTSIALTGSIAQTVKLDLIVIDRWENRAFIAEVKRGGGKSEARKIHQVEWILRCAQVQAIAFLKTLNYHVASARAVLIDVYGRAGYSPDLSVSGPAIDALFGVPVQDAVEAVTGLLADRLHAEVPDLLGLTLASLEPLPTRHRRSHPSLRHPDPGGSRPRSALVRPSRHPPCIARRRAGALSRLARMTPDFDPGAHLPPTSPRLYGPQTP